ncbi:phage antirepressor KilAC domain-containing protein [Staphylococcus aureus]|uniref:phage antirepressor KilAC domain-containing protein n=1 Tax=Staphylococcus aureus TaxID=1280 RepID=UPI001E5EE438|nr:phage antirepressor KilAC domain-containing protein [Staphylococcus aureus]MCE3469852.1 phage antirepressor KilAC domain-containing protein [Staphylococcus aureus]
MNEIKTFSNDMFSILIKQDNENNLFDLETVAKSLGFTQFKNGKQYIRWETINKYLGKYLSQEVGKGDFIPEPMVYKLAFKAGNAVAEKFQDWLAMEVLPAIRKHGISAQKLNKLLHEARLQRKVNKQWVLYSEHMGKSYTESDTIPIVRSDGREDTVLQTRWTQKGRLKIHEIMTEFGYEANVTA